MPESFVVSGVRTPIGRFGGALETRAPWVTEQPAKAFAKPGPSFDTSIGRRFTNSRFDAATTASMPQTAETVARRWGLSRAELDAYALRSHERVNDGAAAVVVVSDRLLRRHALRPRARPVAAEAMGVGQGSALLVERP
ncbi:hypothetical protein [Nonomuraea sp. JJY05]|uniref:thiolase family protein n=1 Tax=Nonomuraea sp. JJY05 TaxID=3350255 RepID=UPI00373E4D2A